jgi:mRNA interferase RelE/StbE
MDYGLTLCRDTLVLDEKLEKAISQAAGFLDGPEGLCEVLDAVDRLAGDPRPAGSFPYGSPDLRRLRAGG